MKDLIVGENNGQVRYFRNNGSVGNPSLTYEGLIQVGGVTLDIGSYSVPWADDWNEDGLIDLLVGESDGVVNLYINEGSTTNPVFNTGSLLTLAGGSQIDVGYRSAPNVVDMNGDGVKDLISGEIYGKILYYQNNGTNANPQLAAGQYMTVGPNDLVTSGTCRTVPIDWDGDGDMDIIAGNYDALIDLFLNVPETTPMPQVTMTLTSGIIMQGGGNVEFTAQVQNQATTAAITDAWLEMIEPDGDIVQLALRTDVEIPGSFTITRNLSVFIPGTAQNGMYYFYLYTGDITAGQLFSSDEFYVYKLGSDDAGSSGEITVSGWFDDEVASNAVVTIPDRCDLSAAPNPFNPETTLRLSLPNAGLVKLAVYDVQGRLVGTLLDGFREAGSHEITWDASHLPSGVYFAKLTSGQVESTQKLLLVK